MFYLQLEKVRQIKIFQYKYKPEFMATSVDNQRKTIDIFR